MQAVVAARVVTVSVVAARVVAAMVEAAREVPGMVGKNGDGWQANIISYCGSTHTNNQYVEVWGVRLAIGGVVDME